MAKNPKLRLEAHLPSAELQQRYRAARDASQARRWQALWLFSQNQPIGTVASIVDLHRNSVRALVKRYNADDPAAVNDRRATNPGSRRPYLSAEQEHALRAALAQPHPDGGVWNGARVARWIAQVTGRQHVYRQFGWAVLRRLGLSPQVPRPRHRQAATPEQQADWKKTERQRRRDPNRAPTSHGRSLEPGRSAAGLVCEPAPSLGAAWQTTNRACPAAADLGLCQRIRPSSEWTQPPVGLVGREHPDDDGDAGQLCHTDRCRCEQADCAGGGSSGLAYQSETGCSPRYSYRVFAVAYARVAANRADLAVCARGSGQRHASRLG